MNISPISFKGQFVYNYNESTLKNHPQWQKNSSVEDTLGSYHVNKTARAYFADPMEPVTDKIKESVDFVVYDNEPAYPAIDDVKQNYLGTLRKNFRDFFEDVRLYFYRREMGGFASKPEAQYKQWEAAECTRMYDEAGDLRYRKETTEDDIKKLETKKANLTAGIKTAQEELTSQNTNKSLVEKHIENLSKMKKPYEELITVSKESRSNELSTYKKLNKPSREFVFAVQEENLKKENANLDRTLAYFENTKKEILKKIEDLTKKIKTMQKDVVETNENITRKASFVEECKAKLVPLFGELKSFYLKQGIKGIKNI